MITVPIHDRTGQQVGTYEFDPSELASGVNRQLLHDVVVMYEANRRVGTARTKSRGEVAGSTKKIYRQKGTGRARMGPKRTPIRRGGGHAFRKIPRDWGYRLPRKAIRLATRMALLSKFLDNQVVLLDDLVVTEPKKKLDMNIWKSARNIPTVRVSPAAELNAYELLHQRQLLLTKAALDRLRAGA
jgi:large subunit ribosomal protein L4